MKHSITMWSITLLSLTATFCSCSDEDVQPNTEYKKTEDNNKQALEFKAEYSPQQKENLIATGMVFLPEQRKDSWNDVIPKDIPTCWGLFVSPLKQPTRAAGIWGAYPAQYWTMLRVKTGDLSKRMRRIINLSVKTIEKYTNVRFYNSQKDPEYYEPYHIKLPNIFITYSNDNNEGSGSFGLVGGEQYIRIPRELDDEKKYTDDEVCAFFMHAFCNAAGMFNEQQRKDRDQYVDIHWENIKDGCGFYFDRETDNYTMLGYFDYNSITLASSKAYSKNGNNTITKKGGGSIAKNLTLSLYDISFLNDHYLPLIARSDLYIELDKVVYLSDGRKLTEAERIDLQAYLNARRNLNNEPPASGRIKREPW